MKPEEALKELSYDDTAYGGNCNRCGQKLDWGEENGR